MPHANYEPSETLFGTRLQELMDSHKPQMEIRDLSDALGSTYEYVRKMVRGLSLPSKYMLRSIAQVFKADLHELERLVAADRIKKEHGDIPFELSGKNPEIEPFERGWDKLTKDQKASLTTMLKQFLTQNRKHARA
jgi:transcriptional regulator with XRE-family HTH domain